MRMPNGSKLQKLIATYSLVDECDFHHGTHGGVERQFNLMRSGTKRYNAVREIERLREVRCLVLFSWGEKKEKKKIRALSLTSMTSLSRKVGLAPPFIAALVSIALEN